MDNTMIRYATADDYKVIIANVDEWWGGRRMAQMLPKLFFVHFCPTSFVAEQNGLIIGFVVGLVSQSYPDEGYIHFVGVHPNAREGGLGHLLYERVFEAMLRNGCRVVRCVTSPVNKGSIAFHLHLGFEAEISEKVVEGVSVFEDYDGPGEDRVLFSENIKEIRLINILYKPPCGNRCKRGYWQIFCTQPLAVWYFLLLRQDKSLIKFFLCSESGIDSRKLAYRH